MLKEASDRTSLETSCGKKTCTRPFLGGLFHGFEVDGALAFIDSEAEQRTWRRRWYKYYDAGELLYWRPVEIWELAEAVSGRGNQL